MGKYRVASDRVGGVLALALALGGCDAFSDPDRDRAPDGPKLLVPTDERAPLVADKTPPAISGGTLTTTPDGRFVIAADPDRDRISIVSTEDRTVREIDLLPGDEPGRVTVSPAGRAFVALRRGGAIVSFDPASPAPQERRDVCGAPRGLAFEAATRTIVPCGDGQPESGGYCYASEGSDRLVVACAGGELVSLPATGGSRQVLARLEPGLRDVIIDDGELRVTNFKRAALLTIDEAGEVSDSRVPRGSTRQRFVFDVDEDGNDFGGVEISDMSPALAWRTVMTPQGPMMLHQQADDGVIDLGEKSEAVEESGGSSYGGGGGFSCDGIVHTTLTRFGPNGQVLSSGGLMGVTLGVDLAIGPNGMAAIAVAGAPDADTPKARLVFPEEGGSFSSAVGEDPHAPAGGDIQVVPVDAMGDVGGCAQFSTVDVDGQVTAVAFLPSGQLVAQSRQPAALFFIDDNGVTEVRLGGVSMADTGHDIFHRDTGAGIACASCHGEGGDDGHVWHFDPIGRRRTQAMHVGLEGTAPFHWDGDMADIHMLMEEVFVGRMGGVHQSGERLQTMENWVFELSPPAAPRTFDEDDALVMRGKALFHSAEVGCGDCHAGNKLTSNESFDVGTGAGGPLQVPSLVGIAFRAPFMHDGCAGTLRDRFSTGCGGGDSHGRTSQLGEEDLQALVAYLETF